MFVDQEYSNYVFGKFKIVWLQILDEVIVKFNMK